MFFLESGRGHRPPRLGTNDWKVVRGFVDGSIGANICRWDGQVMLAVCFLESGGCGALGWRSVTTIGCQLLFATWGLHTEPGKVLSLLSS